MLPMRRKRARLWDDDLFNDDFFNFNFRSVFDDSVAYSTEDSRVLELEVPGFNESNLEVELANGVLTVTGKRDVGEEGCYAGRKEIYKRFAVGSHDNVDATVKDGILRLTLKASTENVKKIDLKVE
jgi:HSP20 family molecular chaperone IbpA